MKRLVLWMALLMPVAMMAQSKIYDPMKDAGKQVDSAIAVAQNEGKYVLCQVGGNWCPWCLRFAQFAQTDEKVSEVIKSHFVYIHVNYSKENKNPETMLRLGNPARFGFPVFVILDENGKVIHIQNSEYLEAGQGYSEEKVLKFLLNWTPEAVKTLK